jgi:hypothetical protein
MPPRRDFSFNNSQSYLAGTGTVGLGITVGNSINEQVVGQKLNIDSLITVHGQNASITLTENDGTINADNPAGVFNLSFGVSGVN